MPSFGTRSYDRAMNGFPSGRSPNSITTADLGLSKLAQSVSVAFSASGRTVTGANGSFASFAVGDQIEIIGSHVNSGYFNVNGVDATNHAFLDLYPSPKDESSVTCTIRTL